LSPAAGWVMRRLAGLAASLAGRGAGRAVPESRLLGSGCMGDPCLRARCLLILGGVAARGGQAAGSARMRASAAR
jgi:hypothetical protein